MRLFGLGPLELLLILTVLAVGVLPAFGIYRIAVKAGYDGAAPFLWAIAFCLPVLSWLVPLGLGFLDWPRDRQLAVVPAGLAPGQLPPPPPQQPRM